MVNVNTYMYKVQEKSIHTPWNVTGISRGQGVLKVKILEAMYEAKLEFPRGSGGAKQRNFRGRSMDIFWNCTIS